jgi:hypothetical protein
MYRSSVTNENQHPTPPILIKAVQYESLTTLPSQEVYVVENTVRSSIIEGNQSIIHHKGSVENKEDEFSQEFSTIHNPIVNGDNEFSSESSIIHTDIGNGDEFSSGFSTVQTQAHTKESDVRNELIEAERIQQSLLTSNGSLNKTLSSMPDEIKYVLNIENLTAYLTGESPSDHLEFINDNLINFVNENAYCRSYGLSVNFECLKQKLMEYIRYLTRQKTLKLSDTVNLVSYPVAETRYVFNN